MAIPDYVELRPTPALRRFVERFWIHRVTAPIGERRLLPDGRMHLVWVAQLGLRVTGPAQGPMRPAPLPEMLAVGATFRPGAAPYLLRTPASMLVDRHEHVEQIDARFARDVDAALQAAHDPHTAVAALADGLIRKVGALPDAPDPAVAHAVAVLDDDAHATVAGAAAHACVSERELQRRFVQDVGYAPKTLQRVLRLQRFLAVRGTGDLAGAAARAGYADQSHLSREARRLTGLTPTGLLGYRH
jgi:AraC-like DNA-binding protein